MELSKDEVIFQLIDKFFNIKDENNIFTINLKNGNSTWTENEFNNFTNSMNNSDFIQEIEDEFLEINYNDDILKINGLSDIIKFYSNENYLSLKHDIYTKKNILNDTILNLFDADVEFDLFNITNIYSLDEKWNDYRKKYKITKKINYTDKKNNIIYVAKIVKCDDENDDFYTLKQSNILNAVQKYEFNIICNDKSNVINAIVKVIQSIFMSSIVLTKKQQQKVLEEYLELIKKDVKINKYNNGIIPLITPKPVTLERKNLIDPIEYGAISILSGYTVTEKADGERLLMYINNEGKCYLINSSYRVEDSGIIAKNKKAYNSLIDGEFILCDKRRDIHKKNIYAAFDIYYLDDKKLTDLPLIDKKKCRYDELKSIESLLNTNDSFTEFIVKTHYYSDDILKDSKNILENARSYSYDIDGLIYTPAKLALYSYYQGRPVELTDNMKWDRVFKWKPEEQNTIDFLIKEEKEVLLNGIRHKEFSLWVGYNVSQWTDINVETGLKLRYDKEYIKTNRIDNKKYIPKLFRPIKHYHNNVDKVFIKIDSKGDTRAENGDKILSEIIAEFRYDVDMRRWFPIRVRDDKTKIFKKGILSKTANDLSVALNIWNSIHAPVTTAMIMGNQEVFSKDAPDNIDERMLESDDIYYSREINRDSLLSVHMLNFHNQGIKQQLYKKSPNKNSILELACGEGGDMNRILNEKYKFVLGVDLVKNNIINPRSGAYSRMLKRRMQYNRQLESGPEKIYFPDIVFAVGDCAVDIKSGRASSVVGDKESETLLKIVMNRNSKYPPYLKYLSGKGADGFDCVSCMFAVHYFFESEIKLKGFLHNVSNNLKKNGVFICTFMDGKLVQDMILKNGGNTIEGRKKLDEDETITIPTWAIIRRYNLDGDENNHYNKKIEVFLENTQKLIPEFLVNYDFLIKIAKEYNLTIKESELFSDSFNKIKENMSEFANLQSNLEQDIIELDKDPVQKQFSFLNRWCVFEKN